MGQSISRVDSLIDAAFAGQDARLTQLLDAGADPNLVVAIKPHGEVTAVVAAVHGNHLTTVKKLLERLEVCDVDRPLGTRRMTALHFAAAEGRDAICAALLAKGQLREDKQRLPFSPGADPRRSDAAGNTVLHVASMMRRLSTVSILTDHCTIANIYLHHCVNHKGQTALQLACENGDAMIVDCLLDAGADPNTPIKTRTRRRTPIWTAVDGGYDNVAVALLDAGCKIESDVRGETLMHAAIVMDRPRIVRALMEHGIDIQTGRRTIDGTVSDWPTPVLLAGALGRVDCLKEMLNASQGDIDRCLERSGSIRVLAPVMGTIGCEVPSTPKTPMAWAIDYPCSFVHRSNVAGMKKDLMITLHRMTAGHFDCVEMMMLCGAGLTSGQLLKLQYQLDDIRQNGDWNADRQRLLDLILFHLEQCTICGVWGLHTEEASNKKRCCPQHLLPPTNSCV